jgi:hypothetical protein
VTAERSRAEAAGFAATIVDLSLGGLAVATDHPVRPGQELRLAFLLPRGDSVAVRASVVGIDPAADGRAVPVAHLQVDEMDTRHRERLGAFLQEASFLSAGAPDTDAILRRPLVGMSRTA